MLKLPLANFYTNYSDSNVVHKSKSVILKGVQVRYKEPLIVDKPVLTLDKEKLWQNVAYTNYFYLKDTKRYYFVDDIIVNHGYIEIKGHTDVLSSFWSFVKTKQCYINRQENVYSKYIVDNEYPVYATRDIDVKNIPCDFLNETSCLLTVTGGI